MLPKFFDYKGIGLVFDDKGEIRSLYVSVKNATGRDESGRSDPKLVFEAMENTKKHLTGLGYRISDRTIYEWPGAPRGLLALNFREGTEIRIFPADSSYVLIYSIPCIYDKSYNSKSLAKKLYVREIEEKDFETIKDLGKILSGVALER